MAAQMEENIIERINESARNEIDQWLAKYPAEQRQSAVMPALRLVQDANGGLWGSGNWIDCSPLLHSTL